MQNVRIKIQTNSNHVLLIVFLLIMTNLVFRCKPGFFNLAIDNEFGCTPCYCHGHSSVCRSASGYSKFVIESIFVRGVEKWKATVGDRNVPIHFDSISQSIVVTAPDRDNVYFEAPGK